MKALYASPLLLAMVLSGCASIFNDKTQSINVSSSTGSEISGTVNGMPFKAPGVVRVVRENKDKLFITETEGCTKETIAEKSIDNKFYLDILGLTYGLFSSTTDFASEKMWRYSENVVISCKK